MKKIVLLWLMMVSLPLAGISQGYVDDLYYVPDEEEEVAGEEKAEPAPETPAVRDVSAPASSSGSVVASRDAGNVRDVDEYNRRYTASSESESYYAEEELHDNEDGNTEELPGEWVNGFRGDEGDYEYAVRLIRFHSPRFAVSVSSPFYWDVVYGINSWDWNVYDDGIYAYVFPTYTNSLWWDWRFGTFGWSWGWPYYSAYWGWPGYYGYWGWGRPYYAWGWHHHWYDDPWHYHHGRPWGPPPARYNARRAAGSRPGYSSRSSASSRSSVGRSSSSSRASASSGRVVGTRSSSRAGVSSATTRTSRSSSASSTRYTRSSSSSSRASATPGYSRSSSMTRRSSSTYNPSESSTRRTYSTGVPSRSSNSYRSSGSSSRSSYQSRSSSSRSSFSSGSISSGRSSGSYSRGGSSSRSSGGSSRSGGGRR